MIQTFKGGAGAAAAAGGGDVALTGVGRQASGGTRFLPNLICVLGGEPWCALITVLREILNTGCPGGGGSSWGSGVGLFQHFDVNAD